MYNYCRRQPESDIITAAPYQHLKSNYFHYLCNKIGSFFLLAQNPFNCYGAIIHQANPFPCKQEENCNNH